jgi:hypothetical protein
MATGAALLLALALVVLHFQPESSSSVQAARVARRLALVSRIRFALGAGSEAEKSAVLAVTDQESQLFADQARAAGAEVEQARDELGELLKADGAPREVELLDQFSQAFAELRRVDEALLGLAVKNTNLKAASLTFGPAAAALREMDVALSRIVAESAAAPDARAIAVLALGAENGALRIETLLPPHVAEESDARMDELEAEMAQEDDGVRRDLAELGALPTMSGSPDLATASLRYARFAELRKEILALSRENTNVLSTTISLSRKRTLLQLCREALTTLQQAIEENAPAGRNGLPANPR